MGGRRLIAVVAAVLLLAGCGTTVGQAPPPAQPAPTEAYPVGVRTFTLDPAGPRPLPVTVWYPAGGGAAADPPQPSAAQPSAVPAAGRFPVVVFSHGLDSLPELHAPLTTRWAAAGFVVAAPTYPRTRRGAARFDRADVRHQPADAWRLIRHLSRLDARRGDPLAGHLDVARFAAAGHSAGGFTTAGMFVSGHSRRLRAGIVIAGGGLAGAFAGAPAPLLFVHGGADRIVPPAVGRAAYDRTPGPAVFLPLPGRGHGEYLIPGHPDFPRVLAATTDFLRWTLYDDPAALRRLPGARKGTFSTPAG